MIYSIRHRTTYTYESAVTFARCVLRLTPTSSGRQTVLSSAVSVTPRASETLRRLGPYGEPTLTLMIDRPHTALVIEARSRIEVHAPPVEVAGAPAWGAVREAAYEVDATDANSPAAFLYPTRRTPVAPAITDYARVSFRPGRPVVEAAAELMARIKADFVYDSKATDVSTLAMEAFDARRGVCQDFAHVMISGLRGLGLPAAYVSGYLRTNPPPGRPRLEGADATHAWVSLWCGEARGWIGFDPTNDLFAQDDHVVLATGRDYADVAPIDGIILSPGEQKLKVEVTVAPEGEEAASAA
ncbi:transglutaminase family protein [Phenylobacterium immobile]|uniref:transglutaminase family protein n=1 Tax=Phenylobacterium immobile TaxID=21 RepID=UPI000A555083|nr:transglutaminase family protein [Phenylobacterium immobile]